ncbi:MAG: enoyl-CoA hydratase/isomerase family protein, partial [Chloroflexi bacterium]|nr:enoyl-CoA hydratase/isomerase family protein [Chloroflexota bacterium]
GIVSMNRPDKLNALSADLKRALVERLHDADRDAATTVVVLRAEGRSFSAGYDISPNPARAARRGNALAWHESLNDDIRLEMTPWDMNKPVVASVQGHCLGGGCELMMLCDLAIAADDALFGEPEIRFSNVGPGLVMPFVVGLRRARELLYLGDTIDARTALAWGMVNRVVPRAELETGTLNRRDPRERRPRRRPQVAGLPVRGVVASVIAEGAALGGEPSKLSDSKSGVGQALDHCRNSLGKATG